MIELKGLTATPFQTFNHSITEGIIYFTLYYRPMVKMWYMDIKFNTIEIYGLRVCYSLNLLHQFYKILPFGLYVRNIAGAEPFLIDDFTSERFTLNILSKDEIITVNDAYSEYKAAM